MGFFGRKRSKKAGAKDDKNKSEGAKSNGASEKQQEQASLPINHGVGNDQTQQHGVSADGNDGQASGVQQPQRTLVTDIPVGDPALATPDVTRDLVKKFIADIWNRGELDMIPSVCSAKIRFNGMSGLDKIGHEGFAQMVAAIHAAFTDYHCEIHSMVVENNKAFCRLRFSGKFTGPILGYRPHGKLVSWMGASEFTCSNGVILKVWEIGDLKTLEEQLANTS